MGKFDGVLICTDLDGTLLDNDKSISAENIKAIEYFKSEGGYFTFVTGRMPFVVSYISDAVKPNAPFGCINGAGLFDSVKNEYIWKTPISDKIIEFVEYADNTFPDIGIQVNTFYKTYFCRENETMANYRRLTKAENLVRDYKDVHEPVAKVLLGSEDLAVIDKMVKVLGEHPLANEFDFTRSERSLYEILPKGSNKGVVLSMLCEHLNIDKSKTITIGDYDNDAPMFKASAVGIAVKNASEKALSSADFVTVSNHEHAVAKVIYDLEKGNFISL